MTTKKDKPRQIQWPIDAPPATRFFLNADGRVYIQFQITKALEVVEWAQNLVTIFQALGRTALQGPKKEESQQESAPPTEETQSVEPTPDTPPIEHVEETPEPEQDPSKTIEVVRPEDSKSKEDPGEMVTVTMSKKLHETLKKTGMVR